MLKNSLASLDHPLACLIMTLCATFGGSMAVNFFTFRKPILSAGFINEAVFKTF